MNKQQKEEIFSKCAFVHLLVEYSPEAFEPSNALKGGAGRGTSAPSGDDAKVPEAGGKMILGDPRGTVLHKINRPSQVETS